MVRIAIRTAEIQWTLDPNVHLCVVTPSDLPIPIVAMCINDVSWIVVNGISCRSSRMLLVDCQVCKHSISFEYQYGPHRSGTLALVLED